MMFVLWELGFNGIVILSYIWELGLSKLEIKEKSRNLRLFSFIYFFVFIPISIFPPPFRAFNDFTNDFTQFLSS
jgi:hypothetical protein